MPFKAEKVQSFKCSHCSEIIEAADLQPLKKAQCPHCGEEIRVPASFGNFHLLQHIGSDDYGTVFRAFDTTLERDVALRILQAEQNDSERMEHFLAEARRLASLDHENTVRVFSIGSFQDQPYVEMELLQHGNAERYLNRDLLTEAEVLDFGLAIADGLRAAHKLGMVHLNVSPSRILIDGDNRPKLVDFGREGLALTDQSIQPYLAPEQIDAKAVGVMAVDRRVDTFGLGASMYHMLTGHAPFPPLGDDGAVDIRLEANPPPVKDFRKDIHPKTEALIKRMMATRPDARFSSDDEMVEMMEAARIALIEEAEESHVPQEHEDVMALAEAVGDDLPGGAAASKSRSSMGLAASSKSGRSASRTGSGIASRREPQKKSGGGNKGLLLVGGVVASLVILVIVIVQVTGIPDESKPTVTIKPNEPPLIAAQRFEFDRRYTVKVAASDPDADELSFEIVGGKNAELFDIDADTGRIRVRPGANVPDEGIYAEVNVKVADRRQLSTAAVVNLKVKPKHVVKPIQRVNLPIPTPPTEEKKPPVENKLPQPKPEPPKPAKGSGQPVIRLTFNGSTKSHSGIEFNQEDVVNFDQGKMGKAIRLDQSRVFYKNKIDGIKNGKITWAMWLKPESDADMKLMELGNMQLVRENGLLALLTQRDQGKAKKPFAFEQALPTGEWRHLAVSYDWDTGQARLYINGELKKEGTYTEIKLFNPPVKVPLNIGFVDKEEQKRYKGLVDEFRLYSQILTPGQVKEIYDLAAPLNLDGLVHYFSFQGHLKTMGGKKATAKDGADFSANKIGKAINLTSKAIDFNETVPGDFSKGLTYAVWARFPDLRRKRYMRLVSLGNGANTDNIIFCQDSGTPSIKLNLNEGKPNYPSIKTGNVIKAKTWQHFAAVIRPNKQAEIYVNGEQVKKANFAHMPNTNDRKLKIGRSFWTQDTRFSGQLDELYIFRRALAPNEVKKIFNKDSSLPDSVLNIPASQPKKPDSGKPPAKSDMPKPPLAGKVEIKPLYPAHALKYHMTFDDGLGTKSGTPAVVEKGEKVFAEGKFGKSLYMPPIKLKLPGQLELGEKGMSVSMWVKWEKPEKHVPIFRFSNNAGHVQLITNGKAREYLVQHRIGDKHENFESKGGAPKKAWHHVAMLVTHDLNSSIYVDGKRVASKSNASTLKAKSPWNHLYLGRFGNNRGEKTMKGWLDELYVFNRVITDKEIKWLADGKSLIEPIPEFKPLNPILVKSSKGSPHQIQSESNSVLWKSPGKFSDKYEITYETKQPTVSAIRLIMEGDPALPSKGPGRMNKGQFSFSEISLARGDINGQNYKPAKIEKVSLVPNDPIAAQGILNGILDDVAWIVKAPYGKAAAVTLKFKTPIKNPEGHRFKVVVHQKQPVGKLRCMVIGGNSDDPLTDYSMEATLADRAADVSIVTNRFVDVASKVDFGSDKSEGQAPTQPAGGSGDYNQANEAKAAKLLRLAEGQLQSKPMDAIGNYQKVVARFKGVPSAEKAKAKLAELKKDTEWWNRVHAQARDADAARMLKLAEQYMRARNNAAARRELERIISDYPDSRHAGTARVKLKLLN